MRYLFLVLLFVMGCSDQGVSDIDTDSDSNLDIVLDIALDTAMEDTDSYVGDTNVGDSETNIEDSDANIEDSESDTVLDSDSGTETESSDTSTGADTETIDTETIDTETIDTETVDTETVDTTWVFDTGEDTETVDTETVDTETDTEPAFVCPFSETVYHGTEYPVGSKKCWYWYEPPGRDAYDGCDDVCDGMFKHLVYDEFTATFIYEDEHHCVDLAEAFGITVTHFSVVNSYTDIMAGEGCAGNSDGTVRVLYDHGHIYDFQRSYYPRFCCCKTKE